MIEELAKRLDYNKEDGVTIHGGRFSDRGDADERASERYTTHGYHKNHGRLH